MLFQIVDFEDNSVKVEAAIKDMGVAWLHEACGEIQAQTQRNTKVKSGKTKGSWEYKVDESSLEGFVGSNYENAIWEEYGTGEYALHGDGRKTPWVYQDEGGAWHRTHGKKPRRVFFNAFNTLKARLQKAAEEKFKGLET